MKMKLLGLLMGVAIAGLVFTRTASASEGVFELGSVNKSSATCYALSVYVSGRYEVVATCRNLTVPFSSEFTRYMMWAADEKGKYSRLGEVINGKLSRSLSTKFVSLAVTAESSGQPRKPSEYVVATGNLKSIPVLGPNESARQGEVVLTPTPTPVAKVVDQQEKSTLAKILATIGRVVGVGFLILLVGVVIMTVVTRRKGNI